MDDARFDKILKKYLNNLAPTAEVPTDTPLKELGLNSMRAIDLMFDLEEEFDFQLPDEAMNDDTFSTAHALRAKVEEISATAGGQG